MDFREIQQFLQNYSQHTQKKLDAYYQGCEGPEQLMAVIRYTSLNGGKKIRPALVYATALAYDIEPHRVDDIACAVEVIHSYSLIHDDLPSMDNDDYRRGKPSAHKQFNEALAILAGDTMHALAFEILSGSKHFTADQQVKMIHLLAKAVGSAGMCGGQTLDVTPHSKPNIETLEHIHRLKTGALFSACIKMCLVCIEPPLGAQEEQCLFDFAEYFGLCFQIRDDILDYENDSKNNVNDFCYPALLGLEQSQQQLVKHANHCIDLLGQLKGNTEQLNQLTQYIVHRDH
ncbi:MAG: polyprenyl synthetase family protein [Candidatus Oxydemutatoraceae bacterium WSBS_2016_MAG_OTU14]